MHVVKQHLSGAYPRIVKRWAVVADKGNGRTVSMHDDYETAVREARRLNDYRGAS